MKVSLEQPIAEESCIPLRARVARLGWMALFRPDHWDHRIVVAKLTEHGGQYYFITIRELHRLDQIADSPSNRTPHINKICRSAQFRLQTQTTTKHIHFSGPARVHLILDIHAPVADLPALSVVEWWNIKAGLTLPYGRIVHDYLA